jgi:peptide-methionine (R)-S-oxide reductase
MSPNLDRRIFLTGAAAAALSACSPAVAADSKGQARYADSPFRKLSDADWKKRLPPASYRVLRHEDTERPGTSALNKEKRRGTYICAGCALRCSSPAGSSRAAPAGPASTTRSKKTSGPSAT